MFVACTPTRKTVDVIVTNPLPLERTNEMVEVSMSDVSAKLKLSDTAQLVVLNEAGEQVPYQLTYDEKLIFPATVEEMGSAHYTIAEGTPETFDVVACGKQYPERVDDIAWENDLVAFRTYGPALQRSGERAFGYDIWTKYNTTQPVVEARYADELERHISYHIDHGNGLDCYKVGPTLGAGTAALMVDGEIIYPYCYASYEILDNGPLRFTVALTYNPLTVRGDTNIVEHRLISLDAGSHLNRTVVTYDNLKEATPVATGIVLHEPDGTLSTDADNDFISYVDPTDNVNNNNGKIFVGAAFPASLKETKVVLFPEKEKNMLRGGADGHLLAISDYTPGTPYIYYWGSAWSKADIKTPEEWNNYLGEYVHKLRQPLTLTVTVRE
jgi:hypothetical protein